MFNIFDKKCWLWSDVNTGVVRGTGAYLDRQTRPGDECEFLSIQLAFPGGEGALDGTRRFVDGAARPQLSESRPRRELRPT